jgi:hypothetical protein
MKRTSGIGRDSWEEAPALRTAGARARTASVRTNREDKTVSIKQA